MIRRLTDKQLRRFKYNPDTGELFRDGKLVTTIHSVDKPYVFVNNVMGHVIAWRLHTGVWPDHQIDHVNTRHGDNRWINLRPATDSQQGANKNKYANNTTGYKGVTRYKGRQDKFKAQAKVNGKMTYLGLFNTVEEAHQAYLQAAKQNHGVYARG